MSESETMEIPILETVTKSGFHEAMERGDVATVAEYFSQPWVRAEAEATDLAIASNQEIWPRRRRRLPWYCSTPSVFVFYSVVLRDDLHVIKWFFDAEQTSYMGTTMAALLLRLAMLAMNSDRLEMLDFLLGTHVLDDAKRSDMLRSLVRDIRRHHSEDAVQILLSHGARLDINIEAPHFAPVVWCGVDHIDLLVESGACLVGSDVLRGAALAYSEDTARRLLEYGADGNYVTGSPLHTVAIEANVPIAEVFVKTGYCDVDVRDRNKQTALMMVAWTIREDLDHKPNSPERVARLLLSYGAEVGRKDSLGRTALHHAVGHGLVETIRVLLQHGADPNAVDDQGRNSIHAMFEVGLWMNNHEKGRDELLLLLEYGADPFACDRDGVSPVNILRRIPVGMELMKQYPQYFASPGADRDAEK